MYAVSNSKYSVCLFLFDALHENIYIFESFTFTFSFFFCIIILLLVEFYFSNGFRLDGVHTAVNDIHRKFLLEKEFKLER
jgi:hypothetical protein